MLNEVIDYISPKPDGHYIDCTLGGGGHSEAILSKTEGRCRLIGIDMDKDAIDYSTQRLKKYPNVKYIQGNFSNVLKSLKEKADGIILDLGVSSHQFDEGGRGFSIRFDGPLDMRMDINQVITAYDIINDYDVEEIARIIKEYGEDRFAKRIARKIVEAREREPIKTTVQLSDVIKKSVGRFDCVIRTFQALRIAVNDELKNIESGLESCVNMLAQSGTIVVISYHSLEDRIAKNMFKKYFAGGDIAILTKKPVMADDDEIRMNPRSRSAKLRAVRHL